MIPLIITSEKHILTITTTVSILREMTDQYVLSMYSEVPCELHSVILSYLKIKVLLTTVIYICMLFLNLANVFQVTHYPF